MSQVTIKLMVDVVGALESGSLSGNLFAFDTHRRLGSQGIGTDALQTAVARGTRIMWVIAPLECEAFVSLEDIVIDRAVCEPELNSYPGSSVTYWIGTVKKAAPLTSYDLVFSLGSHGRSMVHPARLALISLGKTSEKGDVQ